MKTTAKAALCYLGTNCCALIRENETKIFQDGAQDDGSIGHRRRNADNTLRIAAGGQMKTDFDFEVFAKD